MKIHEKLLRGKSAKGFSWFEGILGLQGFQGVQSWPWGILKSTKGSYVVLIWFQSGPNEIYLDLLGPKGSYVVLLEPYVVP